MTAEEIAVRVQDLADHLRVGIPEFGRAPLPTLQTVVALAQYVADLAKIVEESHG